MALGTEVLIIFWTMFGLTAGIFLLIFLYVCFCYCCPKLFDSAENVSVQVEDREADEDKFDSPIRSTGRSAPGESPQEECFEMHEMRTDSGGRDVHNKQLHKVLETTV